MDRLTIARITGDVAFASPVTQSPLVAGLAHDLKLPLQAVLGWVSRLRSGELAPDRREAVLAIIEKNALLLGGLVSELVGAATGAPPMPMTRVPLDLVELVTRAADGLKPFAEQNGVTLCVGQAPPIALPGNESALTRVIGNLLSNAIRFSRPGGAVTCTVNEERGWATFVVRDDGRGIGADFLPHVFEPFSSEYGCGGSGLGLAVVQQVVRQHGGTVRAESAGRDQGATFIVTLPCTSPAAV